MTLDEEKVLKKLTNKHTKESIVLLEYIEKLKKEVDRRIRPETVHHKIYYLRKNILDNDYASNKDKDIAEYQVDVLEDLIR